MGPSFERFGTEVNEKSFTMECKYIDLSIQPFVGAPFQQH
jgi:hypothetical protein